MWPFKEAEDKRFATAAAQAICDSLDDEPERWKLLNDDYLQHDSGIVINTDGFIVRPDLADEPDMNGVIVCAAIDRWVSEMMQRPAIAPRLEIVNQEATGDTPCPSP